MAAIETVPNAHEEAARTRKAATLAMFLAAHGVTAEHADAMTPDEQRVIAEQASVNVPSALTWGEVVSKLRVYDRASEAIAKALPADPFDGLS